MKRNLTFSLLIVILTASLASAQFTPQLFPALTQPKGTSQVFGNIGIYDNFTEIAGGYKYGIGGYSDFDVRLGIIDPDHGDTGFLLAGNFRYQVMEVRIEDPVDMSVGGLFETVIGWDASNFSIGAFGVGSIPIAINEEKDITPYGRLTLRIDKYESDSEFNIALNLGSKYDLNETMALSAEFNIESDYFGFIVSYMYGL